MPSEKEIRKEIMDRLSSRSERLGFRQKFLMTDFDLIRSGLLDSMSFIQFVAELEQHYGIQIDFEKEEPSKFTTLNGLAGVLHKTISA